jgi:hypothetical protein
MTDRPTPFGLVFGDFAPRFQAIARALDLRQQSPADRDAFVLLEPVAHLLRELAPDEVSPDEFEAHLVLLHHAYRHWAAGGLVCRVSQATLARAVSGNHPTTRLPIPAVYLQLPAGRVWRSRLAGEAPEPLDGMFVTESAEPDVIAVLGIFGMHRGRPGFSALGIEGGANDLETAARRDDGSPPFAPLLTSAAAAGVYSLGNPGELMLLTCRLLDSPGLRIADCGLRIGESAPFEGEHFVDI